MCLDPRMWDDLSLGRKNLFWRTLSPASSGPGKSVWPPLLPLLRQLSEPPIFPTDPLGRQSKGKLPSLGILALALLALLNGWFGIYTPSNMHIHIHTHTLPHTHRFEDIHISKFLKCHVSEIQFIFFFICPMFKKYSRIANIRYYISGTAKNWNTRNPII